MLGCNLAGPILELPRRICQDRGEPSGTDKLQKVRKDCELSHLRLHFSPDREYVNCKIQPRQLVDNGGGLMVTRTAIFHFASLFNS